MSRDEQLFAAKWDHFVRLRQTQDSLAIERRGWRRWLLLPYVAFIIPIQDAAVTAQLLAWQTALRSWFQYDPQPPNRFHITLHYVGDFAGKPWLAWLPHTWRRGAIARLAGRAQKTFETCAPFGVQIGPLNAFASALIAEARDDESDCLRALRLALRRALPLRARPPSRWAFLPHATLGYWGDQPTAPLVEALRPFREVEPVRLTVNAVRLTIYTRDPTPYRRDALQTAREEIIAEYRLTP